MNRKRMWSAALLLLLVLSTVLAACGGSGSSKKDTLVFGRGGDSTSLDPSRVTEGETFKVTVNLYETLLNFGDQDTTIQPGLAKEWGTDDGLTYTFKLEEGVKFHDGRMEATDELIRIISKLDSKPSVFINASAIGIYPASETAIYTEKSPEVATDSLGRTVTDWEKKAASLNALGIRTAFTRFGLVLGKNEGALPLMVLPYKMYVGGPVGSGKQWVSWVHVKDVAKAILHVINNTRFEGAVNVTAPFPLRMDDFGKIIGATIHRPHWFPAPSPIMKIALGKKSSLVLEGQFVTPEKLLADGFEFDYPILTLALDNLL